MIYVPKIDISLLIQSIPYVLSGIPYTIGISMFAFAVGNIFGVLLTMVGMLPNRFVKECVRFYISFFRGVPGLVLLFILYFGLPYELSALQASCICFSLTSSAFIGEIYRGSVEGVDSGQWDAAYALGFPFRKVMGKIILPQALRISVPALGNVAMDLLKSTSLTAMITVPDIFQKAKIVGGREFDYMTMYILVAIIYWLLCILIGKVQVILEKRFENFGYQKTRVR